SSYASPTPPPLHSFPTRRSSDLAVEDVYVIGDCAAIPRADGRMQPQLSQTSIAMGTHVGRALALRAEGRGSAPFSFKDAGYIIRSEEHTSELQSRSDLVCRLLLE